MFFKHPVKIFRNSGWVILLIGITTCATAQQWTTVKRMPEKEAEFRRALRQYISKDYDAAFVSFESLTNSKELHQRMTASLLMTGKCLYNLDRFTDAIPYFEKLINLFPRSKYVDDAYFAKAACNYSLGQYLHAAQDLLWIVDASSEERLISKSIKFVNLVMQSKLTLTELHNLLQFAQGENSSALVTLKLAQKELLEGSNEKAVAVLKDYKQKYRSKKYASKIDLLLKEAERPGARPIKLGVILPLTGYYAEEGSAVLRGIKFAQMQEKGNANIPVQLVIRDSQSNMIRAIHEIKRFITQENVRVVIGELESEVTAGIGALASVKHIPVIAPAATENEVASVGETVYQLNSNLERKGEALAQYAFNTLGLRTFATLAPGDEYGQQLTDSFTATIDHLGGRIIAQSWYYGSPEDLSRQFKSIRDAAFHYDSTDVAKLLREAEKKGEELKEKDIPVLSIDGIFFPIYSEDLKYVAPQFALSNIQTQILGGEYWDNLETLKEPQIEPYINGVIFVSDYFPDEDSREFRRFRSEFRMKMKKTPERWEVFGYDAFNVINEVIKNGARTSQKINQKLSSLSEFKGMKGNISFKGNHRVNKEVHFLQFINGKIINYQLSR